MMRKAIDTLKGKKTYITAIAALLSAFAGYISGDVTLSAALQLGFQAILAATIRGGISSTANRGGR